MKLVGVICGGFSSEFEISLKSGETIVNNLSEPFSAVKVILDKKGASALWNNEWYPVDLPEFSILLPDGPVKMDYALIYIHGDPGENGRLQAMFDMYGIPYINSGALASELSFDKWYCNQFLRNFGVKVAKSALLLKGDTYSDAALIEELGMPLFVKPCDSGSSYGISRVNSVDELKPAIEKAFAEGDSVVIESFLDGTEVTCGVYRTESGVCALPLAEIVSENEFFDYEAKYLGKSQEIVPARISAEATEKVQAISKRIYELLRFRSIARMDYMLVNNEPILIEVNTTPGFTEESIVPRMLRAQNISLKDFWSDILAFETSRINKQQAR